MGSATVSFGLVSIPTKVFTCTESTSAIRFNMLHEKCGTRIKQKLYCEKDDRLVERDELIKGYEFSKGQYVTFTPQELKALEAEATRAIDIKEFISADLVDPVYYDRAYYLSPEQGGERAYGLLAEAMRRTNRVGLANYAVRGKEYLVMLRTQGGALIMQQLHYANEVKSVADVPLPEKEVNEAELALAIQLIDQVVSDEFTPENYQDTVASKIREAIDKKIDGQEVIVSAPEAPKAQIIDLMDALKSSLGMSPEASGDEVAEKRRSAKRAPREVEDDLEKSAAK